MHPPALSTYGLSAFPLLSVAALVGFYAAYVARWLRLPSIIGYMAAGVIFGPSLLGFFGEPDLERFSFIPEAALGFVA